MERIGRYEIIRELGRGAMGAVFQARDPQIDRIVAIKVILTESVSKAELENFKQRFHREARAAGKMSHAGIVTIHDIAEDKSGRPYLVMEFIEGRTLEKMMEEHGAQKPVLAAHALDIGIQVAEALDYAHRRGVVHRDIKPANILLTEEGVAKIADFGIAKMEGTQLTQTGHMLGTPAFMSPEQFSGAAIDARSDLFSLGAILYWMLTGAKPFEAATLSEVTYKIVFGMPPEPRQVNPALPAGVDTVLERCLAKKPELRYATCRELAEDLDAVMTGKAVKATPLPVADKTVVVPAGLPPLPATASAGGAVAPGATLATPAQTIGGGQAQPPAASSRTQASPVAVAAIPQKTSLFARLKLRPLLWGGIAAVLLLAAMAGGMMIFRGGGEPSRASLIAPPREAVKQPPARQPEADPAPAPAPPPAGPETAEPAATSKGKSKGRSSARGAIGGPRATLRIECLHNFRDATLEISSDGRTILTARLRGQEQGFGGVAIVSGAYRTSLQVPAGERDFRVRVHSRRSDFDEYDLIGGRFAEGASRTMVIEFGKGSGIGVFDRKLTLRWK